jgi:hypothetical protein
MLLSFTHPGKMLFLQTLNHTPQIIWSGRLTLMTHIFQILNPAPYALNSSRFTLHPEPEP